MGSARASTPAGRNRASKRVARPRGAKATRRPATPAAATDRKRPASKARKPAAARPRKPAAKPRKTPARTRATAAARRPLSAGGVFSSRNLVALALLAICVGAAYQLWFRNAPLVAVEDVTVEGIAGPQRQQVVAALTEAASGMTTLNVDEDALGSSVARFVTVTGVSADADFPHGLAITVSERPPVLIARQGGRSLPVAGDGTVLAGVEVGDERLPGIKVGELPGSGKLTGDGLRAATVMGAAPQPFRELVENVDIERKLGVEVTLRGGIPVYFGGAERVDQKWAAAVAVLADPKIDTLTYLDVRVPERPAVGGAAPAVVATTTETSDPAVTGDAAVDTTVPVGP